jgi:predicted nucleic acid-binding Zn ribbon protein
MKVECPKCEYEFDVTDSLPQTASEEEETDCPECGAELWISWEATAMARIKQPGDT